MAQPAVAFYSPFVKALQFPSHSGINMKVLQTILTQPATWREATHVP